MGRMSKARQHTHYNTGDNAVNDKKVYHVILGYCIITEKCLSMQDQDPQTPFVYVERDGNIIEVSPKLIMTMQES
jgi:hypothetical protein